MIKIEHESIRRRGQFVDIGEFCCGKLLSVGKDVLGESTHSLRMDGIRICKLTCTYPEPKQPAFLRNVEGLYSRLQDPQPTAYI